MYSTVFTRLNAALDRTSQSHKRSIQSEECGVNWWEISYNLVMYTIQALRFYPYFFRQIIVDKQNGETNVSLRLKILTFFHDL